MTTNVMTIQTLISIMIQMERKRTIILEMSRLKVKHSLKNRKKRNLSAMLRAVTIGEGFPVICRDITEESIRKRRNLSVPSMDVINGIL